ncbi:hypothetical protein CRUP_009977 [Coryphaenoides rupestris]|nr:hypothetical protein CRUP_009977 [Coryphaenoides rupestris]
MATTATSTTTTTSTRNAECCQDHVHCCPGDTLCDADASSCVNDTASVPWVEGTPAILPTLSKSFRMVRSYDTEDDDNICPDESRCPPEYSCLRALTRFSCCPLAQGISCGDGKHCCPAGHQCSADSRSCIQKEAVCAVICGDKESECPEETTCCGNSDGSWGCCPLAEGVCCEDRVHCCPAGSACNVDENKCVSLTTSKEMPIETCCMKANHNWGCCPLDQAVCCADMIHCCPHGMRCNLRDHTCDSGSSLMPLVETPVMTSVPAKASGGPEAKGEEVEEEAALTSLPTTTTTTTTTTTAASQPRPADTMGEEVVGGPVQCDPVTTCPVHTTCCFMSSSKHWGCCPIPKAVCCANGEHCCPTNYKCDESTGTCYKGEVAIPWYTKVPAVDAGSMAAPNSVACDVESKCPIHFTCCLFSSGQWGCCPLYEVTRIQLLRSVPFTRVALPQTQPRPQWEGDLSRGRGLVTHCHGTFFCSGWETCCRILPNAWACCSTSNAVCCMDMKHCCPAGYTCHVGGTCTPTVAVHWNNWRIFLSRPEKSAGIL